jgi:hypothetical protein
MDGNLEKRVSSSESTEFRSRLRLGRSSGIPISGSMLLMVILMIWTVLEMQEATGRS